MDTFVGPGIAMEMEVAAEEVVLTQDEVEAKADVKPLADAAVCQNSVFQDITTESNAERVYYPGDSSEDEYSSDDLTLPVVTRKKANKMRARSAKDDCVCWECGKRFQSLTLLMRHFRTHKTRVHCNICQVTFRRMVSLSMHLENVHNNIDLFCTACRLFFGSKWDLNKHLEEHVDLESPPLLLRSPSRSDSHKKMGAALSELARNLDSSELLLQTSTSIIGENLKDSCNRDSLQEVNDLHTSVAHEPAYNNRNGSNSKKNGIVTTTYALRMRHTKTLTKVFPRESLPESAHQKKIQLFVFRSVDRRQVSYSGGQDETEKEKKMQEEEDEDVKPDISSLNLPLHNISASGGLNKQEVKQEDVVSDNTPPLWEGAPLEESQLDDSLEENLSDGGNTLPSWESSTDSDSKLDDVSDSTTLSFSSGNSSGSSYCPNRRMRRIRAKRTKQVVVDRKKRTGLLLAPEAVTESSIKCPCCGGGPYDTVSHLQHHKATCKNNAAHCPVCNVTFPNDIALMEHEVKAHSSVRPSRMYACESCREVFPTLLVYRRHQCSLQAASNTETPKSAPLQDLISESVTAVVHDHTFRPANHMTGSTSTGNETKPSGVLPSAVGPTSASAPMQVDLRPSTSSYITTSSCSPNSSNVAVTGAVRMTVPCSIPNSTLITPVSVPCGSGFPVQRIVLPVTSQSGSRPIMATVLMSSGSTTGKVAHMVLQSQGLTFPTPTVTQSVLQKQPLGLSSIRPQTQTVNQTQALPSLQLANLLVKGIIQPNALIRPPQPCAMTATPHSTPSSVSVQLHSAVPRPIFVPVPAPVAVPVCNQVPISVPVSKSVPLLEPKPSVGTVSLPVSSPAKVSLFGPTFPFGPAILPAAPPVAVHNSNTGPESLRILGLYVNCSQEFALKRRLQKSWQSKGVFLCRQCGAVSRQPSLSVRHRYLHRGFRPYRCHCGRTFLRLLHLLRHHIQHAEATRFVCAPCGQTFSGARDLARHKKGWMGEGKRRGKIRKDCQAPFYCDCGQFFQRPAAFLWHKLKNPDRLKRV